MTRLLKFIAREPVVTQSAVVAFLGMLTSLGLGLSAEAVGGIVGFSAVVLALIARAFVSPTVSRPSFPPPPVRAVPTPTSEED